MRNYQKILIVCVAVLGIVSIGAVITRIPSDLVKIGSISAGDKILEFENNAGSANPKIKWSNTLGKLQFSHDGSNFADIGSGGGGSSNYVENGTGDSSVDGVSAYADSAATTPADGTGGSPTVTVTQNTTSSGTAQRLSGAGDFKLSKASGANKQGQGWSIDLTPISRADQGQVLEIAFDYRVTTDYPDEAIHVWVYDKDNSALIQPAPYKIKKLSSGSQAKFLAKFQAPTNADDLRLIFHISATDTADYDLGVDNISVSRQLVNEGPAVFTHSFTPTITNGGTTSVNTGEYSRVGAKLFVNYVTTYSGAGSGTLYYNLPTGISIDLTKHPAGSKVGTYQWDDAGTNYIGSVIVNNATRVELEISGGSASFDGSSLASGDDVYIQIDDVSVLGWASTVAMSADAGTNSLVYGLYTAGSESWASSDNISWGTVEDTHRAMSSGVYTVPISGVYCINFTGIGSSSPVNTIIYKNNASFYNLQSIDDSAWVSGGGCFKFNSGDYFDIRNNDAGGTTLNSGHMQVVRIANPQQIAASEKVFVEVSRTTSQAFGSDAVVELATEVRDTHGAFDNASTFRFTCPRAGNVRFDVNLDWDTDTWAQGDSISVAVRKNGTSVKESVLRMHAAGAYYPGSSTLSGSKECVAGDYFDVYVSKSTSATPTIYASSGRSVVTFEMQ